MDIRAEKNPFALVCDEVLDPFEILEQAERIQKLTLDSSEVAEKEIKPVKTEDVPVKDKKPKRLLTNQDCGDVATPKISEQYEATSGPQNPMAGDDDNESLGKEAWITYGKPKASSKFIRGRGILPKRGATSRRGGFNERGKREFDRQSGSPKSGVKPIAKREGGGARNWGRSNDDFQTTGEITPEEGAVDDIPVENADKNSAIEQARSGMKGVMTYDEWKQSEMVVRSVPAYKLRKPGEGADQSQWGQSYVMKKKSDDAASSSEDEAQKGGRKKTPKPVGITFGQLGVPKREHRQGKRGKPKPSDTAKSTEASAWKSLPQASAPQLDNLDEFPLLGDK